MIINFVVLSRRSLKLRKSASVEEGTVGSLEPRSASGGRKLYIALISELVLNLKWDLHMVLLNSAVRGLNVIIKSFSTTFKRNLRFSLINFRMSQNIGHT